MKQGWNPELNWMILAAKKRCYCQTGNQEQKAAALPHAGGVAWAKQECNSELESNRSRGCRRRSKPGRLRYSAGHFTLLPAVQTCKSAVSQAAARGHVAYNALAARPHAAPSLISASRP